MSKWREFASGGDDPPEAQTTRRKRKRLAESNPVIVVPTAWLDTLATVPGEHAHEMMLWLLRLSWEQKSRTVVVSRVALNGSTIRRNSRRCTLIRLQRAGLIIFEPGGPYQSPRATILYPPWHSALPYLTKE
jgi:hypothetical protein